jgi:hypothetical protein
MSENLLMQFAKALKNREIRVIDLSQPLDADTAVIQLPPEFGKPWPFRMEKISKYDAQLFLSERGNESVAFQTNTSGIAARTAAKLLPRTF